MTLDPTEMFFVTGSVDGDIKVCLFSVQGTLLAQSYGDGLLMKSLPSWHCLSVQTQQWKHLSNRWNLFKVNNKSIRTTSFAYCFGVFVVDVEQVNTGWVSVKVTNS